MAAWYNGCSIAGYDGNDNAVYFCWNPNYDPAGGGGGGGDDFGGGGREPDIPGPRPLTDCQRLANIVEQLARDWTEKNSAKDEAMYGYSADGFRDALYKRFNTGNPNEFGSSGFKRDFRDDGNQVRHYVGAFRAGYALGGGGGRVIMDAREYGQASPVGPVMLQGGGVIMAPRRGGSVIINKHDLALNPIAARHGSLVEEGIIRPDQLADAIRRDVCE